MTTTATIEMTTRRRLQGNALFAMQSSRSLDASERQARRRIPVVRATTTGDRNDLFAIDRRSLFEGAAPERC